MKLRLSTLLIGLSILSSGMSLASTTLTENQTLQTLATAAGLVETPYTITTSGGAGAGATNTTTLDPSVQASTDYTISFDFSYTASEFANQWGTALLASGNAPAADNYTGGFQLYLSASNALLLKTGNGEGDDSKKVISTTMSGSTNYSLTLAFSQATQTITYTLTDNNAGTSDITGTFSATNAGFDQLSTNAPGSTTIKNLKVGTPSSAVPEPTTTSLALVGLAALIMRRRRH
ncbi:MAG: PEP-CTERM sorting domain-containing protein [Akkermansia sp.]